MIERFLKGELILRSPDEQSNAVGGDTTTEDNNSNENSNNDSSQNEEGDDSSSSSSSVEPTGEEAVVVARGRERRIEALTAEKWEERRRAAAAEAEAAKLRERLAQFEALGIDPSEQTNPPNNSNNSHTFTREQLEQRARELANIQASEMHFRNEIDKEANDARRKYQDFDSSVANLQKFGPLSRDFLQMVLEAGATVEGVKPGDLIYSLGKDLNEADRILSLPPIRQAVALAGFASKLRGNNNSSNEENILSNISNAPPPISSNRPAAVSRKSYTLDDPNMPMEQWIKAREKQLQTNR